MTRIATRDAYRAALLDLARTDARIFCVDSDTGGLEDTFATELPGQYVNVGIAEANLFGVSAGLAAAGLIPYAHTMSAFATLRAAEQLRTDIAANKLPVRVVATHGGLSAGHYGPSHHALEDLAIARSMPGLTVVVPADAAQTTWAVKATAYHPGPVFLRLGRGPTPAIREASHDLAVGRAIELGGGDDITLIACGPLPTHLALDARRTLAGHSVAARVLGMHTIAPLDAAAVECAARQTAGIVTVEDHLATGGLGGAVCEVVCATRPCPVRRIGAPTGFLDRVGTEAELLEDAGVTAERVVAAALDILVTNTASKGVRP